MYSNCIVFELLVLNKIILQNPDSCDRQGSPSWTGGISTAGQDSGEHHQLTGDYLQVIIIKLKKRSIFFDDSKNIFLFNNKDLKFKQKLRNTTVQYFHRKISSWQPLFCFKLSKVLFQSILQNRKILFYFYNLLNTFSDF